EVPDVAVSYVGAGMGPFKRLSRMLLCTSSLLVTTSRLETARRTHSELCKRIGTSTFSATNSVFPIAFNITQLVFIAADRSPIPAPGYDR
ncbi:hypothetical protein BKA82DRAFT_1000510, partial [Pisolithus tinctorius]